MMALVVALLMAGCVGGSPPAESPQEYGLMAPPPPVEAGKGHAAEPPSSNGTHDAPPASTTSNVAEKPEPAIEWQHIEVYSSSGWVVAAAPAHPLEPGPLVDDEPVRQDTFMAPPGTVGFDITVRDSPLSIRSGGIEIYNSTGALVYADGPLLGWNVPLSAGCARCTADYPFQKARPGLHTVAYYMIGAAAHMTVIVEAVVEVSLAQEDTPAPPPAAGGNQDEIPIEPVEVYSSSGWVVGAAPAHPFEYGPLVNDTRTFRQDTFMAPPGTTRLGVSTLEFVGAYSGGIEITDANGTVVFLRESGLYQAGAGGISVMGGALSADFAQPGLHSVSYYVAGTAHMTVAVKAYTEG
jgi:hypothetical protein